MKIIRMRPNESGAYSPIQEGNSSSIPEGMALWPEGLSTGTFYAYKGFVFLSFGETEAGHYVTDCVGNDELFEAWEAEHPETEPEPEPEEEMSVWDELDAAYQEGVNSI